MGPREPPTTRGTTRRPPLNGRSGCGRAPSARPLLGGRQRDHAQQHRQRAVPQGRQREHRADRDRPALVARRAPDDELDADRAADESGIGIDAQVPPLPVLAASRSNQANQLCGISTNETATIAAVDPSAIASDRHSRRSANHSRPTPGVIFVSSTKAQVHGHRNPHTIATVSRSEMLPPAISIAPTAMPSRNRSRPVRTHTAPMRIAVHAARTRPRQEVERVDEHRERRRVGVCADRVPVGAAGVQVVEVQPVVGARILRRDDLAGERVADVDGRVGADDHEHPDDDGDGDVDPVAARRERRAAGMAPIVGQARAGAGNRNGRRMPAGSNAFAARAFWKIARGIPRREASPTGQLPRTPPSPAIRCPDAPSQRDCRPAPPVRRDAPSTGPRPSGCADSRR